MNFPTGAVTDALRMAPALCMLATLTLFAHWRALEARANLVVKRLVGEQTWRGAIVDSTFLAILAILSTAPGFLVTLGDDSNSWREHVKAIAAFSVLAVIFHLGLLWLSFQSVKKRRRELFAAYSWLDGNSQEKIKSVLNYACTRATFGQAWGATVASMFAALNLRYELKTPPRYTGEATVVALAIVVALTWVIYRIVLQGRVGGRLIAACFSDWFDEEKREDLSFVIGRWRSKNHYRMFRVAREVERCLPQLRRRLSDRDYQTMVTAYLELASTLREDAIRLGVPKSKTNVLLWAATALVVNDDPVASARRISRFIAVSPEGATSLKQHRLVRLVSIINQAIEVMIKPVAALAVISIATYYVASGDVAKLLKFVGGLLGAS